MTVPRPSGWPAAQGCPTRQRRRRSAPCARQPSWPPLQPAPRLPGPPRRLLRECCSFWGAPRSPPRGCHSQLAHEHPDTKRSLSPTPVLVFLVHLGSWGSLARRWRRSWEHMHHACQRRAGLSDGRKEGSCNALSTW